MQIESVPIVYSEEPNRLATRWGRLMHELLVAPGARATVPFALQDFSTAARAFCVSIRSRGMGVRRGLAAACACVRALRACSSHARSKGAR